MIRFVLTASLGAIAMASSSIAGGWFVLTLGQPSAHPDARAQTAPFVIQVYGCSAAAADIRVTAEGLVNGERRTVALTPVRLAGGAPASASDWPRFSFAVPRGWPSEGAWAVKVVAATPWLSQSALVFVNDTGIDRARTRLRQTFDEREIDLALRIGNASSAQMLTAGPAAIVRGGDLELQ